MRYFTVFALCTFPFAVNAAVIISEVAWMGSGDSPNHEWIELHNTGGDAVDLTGWTLQDGGNLSIDLEGELAAGAFAVLERTSDESAPGSAFMIYTGALVNSGATLSLIDTQGVTQDRVVGGADWEAIGGDNVAKLTPQRNSTSWITAEPTPGKSNAKTSTISESAAVEETTTGSAGQTSRSSGRQATEPIVLELPDITLQLEIEGSSQAYVNQPVQLGIKASGIGNTWLNSLRHQWNFGDGHVATGETVTHRFTRPGTYVVTVYSEYKRHNALGRHEITVLPVRLSLERTVDNEVLLHNDSPYEVDISGYTVQGLTADFTFPPHSKLLARQSVLVPELDAEAAVASDETGLMVATLRPTIAYPILTISHSPEIQLAAAEISTPSITRIASTDTEQEPVMVGDIEVVQSEQRFGFVRKMPTTTPVSIPVATTSATSSSLETGLEAELVTVDEVVSSSSQIATAAQPDRPWRDWWLSALIVLLAVSVVAIYTSPTKR